MIRLIVCETAAAFITHLRVVTEKAPVRYSGHFPRPKSLCDMDIAWDTQLPLISVTCSVCIAKALEVRVD